MPVKLTDTSMQAALRRAAETGKRVDISDASLAGLRIRLTPSGSRTWVLACRDTHGQMRRFRLGEYPDLGISAAREAARAMRAEVRKGADPVLEARRKRAIGREARAGIGTLRALLDLYAMKKGAALKSWSECSRRIGHVFARHLSKPLATMKVGDLQMTADAHPAPQSAAAAVRYLRPVLKWASAPGRDYVPAELARIVPPAIVKRRERVLSREELERLLPVLRTSSRPYAAAMQFMLLTLARRDEVCTARWRDVDLRIGIWTIHQPKNRQMHIVPLSRQALHLLRVLQPELLKPEALIFATMTGNALGNWDRETKALQEESQTLGWTRHDLRRTGATMLGDMGELPDIIEAALNHVSIRSSLAATYNRSRYRPQVAAALQRLADAIDGIVTGAGEVVQIQTM